MHQWIKLIIATLGKSLLGDLSCQDSQFPAIVSQIPQETGIGIWCCNRSQSGKNRVCRFWSHLLLGIGEMHRSFGCLINSNPHPLPFLGKRNIQCLVGFDGNGLKCIPLIISIFVCFEIIVYRKCPFVFHPNRSVVPPGKEEGFRNFTSFHSFRNPKCAFGCNWSKLIRLFQRCEP